MPSIIYDDQCHFSEVVGPSDRCNDYSIGVAVAAPSADIPDRHTDC